MHSDTEKEVSTGDASCNKTAWILVLNIFRATFKIFHLILAFSCNRKMWPAAMAPWFRLHLQSCGPVFTTQAHHLYHWNWYWNEKRTKINVKEAGIGPVFFNTTHGEEYQMLKCHVAVLATISTIFKTTGSHRLGWYETRNQSSECKRNIGKAGTWRNGRFPEKQTRQIKNSEDAFWSIVKQTMIEQAEIEKI